MGDIEASLSHGKIWFNKPLMKLFYILVPIFIISGIILTIGFIVMYFEGRYLSLFGVVLLTSTFFIMCFLGAICCIGEIKRQNKLKYLVKQCLSDKDIVERKATIKSLEKRKFGMQPVAEVRVQVAFQYRDKMMMKDSKKHHKFFNKYDRKTVHILYSPKYDEVLILKQKK